MRNLLPLAAVLFGGCAATPPPATIGDGQCRSEGLGAYVGQLATSELGGRMLATSGASVLRWVQPGQMVTMEFRGDRLTVRLDGANRVLSANCG